jgi:hypothetical protein
MCEWIPLRQGVIDTTLCDNACQWLATCQQFFMGTKCIRVSSTDNWNIVESGVKHHNPIPSGLNGPFGMRKFCILLNWIVIVRILLYSTNNCKNGSRVRSKQTIISNSVQYTLLRSKNRDLLAWRQCNASEWVDI